MAKLKDRIIKQQEEIDRPLQHGVSHRLNEMKHQQEEFLFNPKSADVALKQLVNRSLAKIKHQWREDMPDLEGKALADAEKQFDYDSWLGEHGIGE